MRSRSLFALGALAATLAPMVPAQAALITDLSAFPIPEATVNFNQFTGSFTMTNGPIQVGTSAANAVTLTSSVPTALGAANFGVGQNGMWNSSKSGFAGMDGQNGSMTFTFDNGPVRAVGGFLNYSPDVAGSFMFIEALDSTGERLEIYNIKTLAPITTPDGINQGAFRGIVRANADIAAFRLSNCYTVVDDLQFSRSAISAAAPEHGTLALAAMSIPPLGIVFFRRRRTV